MPAASHAVLFSAGTRPSPSADDIDTGQRISRVGARTTPPLTHSHCPGLWVQRAVGLPPRRGGAGGGVQRGQLLSPPVPVSHGACCVHVAEGSGGLALWAPQQPLLGDPGDPTRRGLLNLSLLDPVCSGPFQRPEDRGFPGPSPAQDKVDRPIPRAGEGHGSGPAWGLSLPLVWV